MAVPALIVAPPPEAQVLSARRKQPLVSCIPFAKVEEAVAVDLIPPVPVIVKPFELASPTASTPALNVDDAVVDVALSVVKIPVTPLT